MTDGTTNSGHHACLWTPPAGRAPTQMSRFRAWVAAREGIALEDYQALQQWSIADVGRFWQALYDYFDIQSDSPSSRVLSDGPMWDVRWFEGAQVNFARNILRGIATGPERVAMLNGGENGISSRVTRGELLANVQAFAAWLHSIGIGKGSRVAAYVSNNSDSITAFLACAAIGAVWSSVAPEFGLSTICDRFEQFEPELLIATDGYLFNGRVFDRTADVDAILARTPSIGRVVHLPSAVLPPDWPGFARPTTEWAAALAAGRNLPFRYAEVDFSHPLITCFSSGTTGKPKGIVHGHGGVTLEAYKMSALQGDLGVDDVACFFSTAGWIVWFMAISALSTGTTLALYDGNPLARDGAAVWDFVADTRTTFFTISSGFLSGRMQAGARPNQGRDLSALRAVVFGAAPASPEAMTWVAQHVGHGVQVATASGGTEIFTCFFGYCPDVPSYAGEFQCTWLGTDAVAMGADGRILHGEVGELVIRQPMPTMPVQFLNDPDRARLRAAYFEDVPGLWRHGDLFITLADGTSQILGRSDATLNRGGVRIGTAEIYRIIEDDPAVADSLVVAVDAADGSSRLWLFLVMEDGAGLSADVRARLQAALRRRGSPRHVPDEFRVVPAIPYNITGKKLEVPVKRLLMGAEQAKVLNPSILRDPGAIAPFVAIAREIAAG